MTPQLTCIAEHTIDLSLLNRDSKVLDLGCRAFSWSKAMLEYVDRVYCVDADPDVKSDDHRLPLYHGAVFETPFKQVLLKRSGNGTGNRVYRDYEKHPIGEYVHVNTLTINYLIRVCGRPRDDISEALKKGDLPAVQFFDVIKFDIESSEIQVLLSLVEPPARQLSVEFHMHTGTPRETVEKVFTHLQSLGYEIVYKDYSRKHGLPENYWDVLFILKNNP